MNKELMSGCSDEEFRIFEMLSLLSEKQEFESEFFDRFIGFCNLFYFPVYFNDKTQDSICVFRLYTDMHDQVYSFLGNTYEFPECWETPEEALDYFNHIVKNTKQFKSLKDCIAYAIECTDTEIMKLATGVSKRDDFSLLTRDELIEELEKQKRRFCGIWEIIKGDENDRRRDN